MGLSYNLQIGGNAKISYKQLKVQARIILHDCAIQMLDVQNIYPSISCVYVCSSDYNKKMFLKTKRSHGEVTITENIAASKQNCLYSVLYDINEKYTCKILHHHI